MTTEHNPCGIDLHDQVIEAKVISVFPDLWGVRVVVITEELGLLESNLSRISAGDVKEGDDISVRIYCSNLRMSPLFSIEA